MDLKKVNDSILSSEKAEKLKKLSQGDVGRSVADMIDEASLNRALQENDANALQNLLGQILRTPEGKALAREVKKAVSQNGN